MTTGEPGAAHSGSDSGPWIGVMQLQQSVELRALPDGHCVHAVLETVAERSVRIGLDSGSAVFDPGTCVEIVTGEAVLLGVVQTRAGDAIEVTVEHALDRRLMAELSDVWGPAGLAPGNGS